MCAASVICDVMREARIVAKMLPTLAACWLVQGCVGGFIARTKTQTFMPPSIREKAAIDAVGTNSGSNLATADWLQKYWGKPKSTTLVSKETLEEIWTYKFGWVWCGVVPWVVVPIPLVVPVQRQKIVFHVRDNRIISADVVDWDVVGNFGPIHR